MRVSIICTDPTHPINTYLQVWIKRNLPNNKIELVREANELSGGDILFLVSCSEKLLDKHRALYGAVLVLHASDLPRGRGWSPHIWELAGGASHITLSLLEAEDKIDCGRIWKKLHIPVPNTALWDEINHILFTNELQLMDFAIKSYNNHLPQVQALDVESSYYRLRTPQDSKIDPNLTIAEQFDLIRVCDPNRFPSFFEFRGERFKLKLERYKDESN